MADEFKKIIIQWEKINRRIEELGLQIQPITDKIKEQKHEYYLLTKQKLRTALFAETLLN